MTKVILAITLCFTMVFTGCSTAWVTTLDSILAAAAPALINILQIVAVANGTPINAGLATKINTDAATIKTLAGDFANASVAAGPSACQQLTAAITTYSNDEQQVLQLAQVSDQATQQKIVVLSGLVASTIGAIVAVIPSCQSSLKASLTKKPPISVSNFVSSYNSALTAKTGQPAVDAITPKLKLRQHSALVRYSTFGLVK